MSTNPTDVLPSDAPTMGSPPVLCGSTSADVSAIVGARGIAVEANGTIYFTREAGNRSYVGRWIRNQAIEPTWFQLPNNAQPRLLRMENSRELLFVSDIGLGNLYAIGYSRLPLLIRITQGGIPAAHGLAVAADGSVFVSSGDGNVHRVVADVVPSKLPATAGPIFPAGQRPLGMAFGPGGYLYVGSSNSGIKRFQVQNNMLVGGVDHGTFNGAASDLAFDVQGRLYIADAGSTARALAVIEPNGSALLSRTPAGMYSGLAFGRGVLSCLDLYAADSVAAARVFPASALSLDLP
jgi:streptogramin lyase